MTRSLGSVRITSLKGSKTTVLTPQPGHYIEPAFSADGKQVLYRKIEGGYLLSPLWSMDPGIYHVSADGKKAPQRVSKKGFNAHFNADASRVFYISNTGKLGTELLLSSVNLKGNDSRDHLQNAKATQFRVSPDGQWVAFTENFRTYLAPFFSNGKTITLTAATKDFSVRQVAARSGEFLTWSSDSQAIDWSHGRYLYRRDLSETFAFEPGAPESLPEPLETGLDLAF